MATKNAEKSASYSKQRYDSKVKSSFLKTGDRVLVRNLTPRGGTGKLRSYWEDKVHVIVSSREDVPIYKVKAEDGTGKERVLHRNLLMQCTHLQSEKAPQQTTLHENDKPPRSSVQKYTKSNEEGESTSSDEEDDIIDLLQQALASRKLRKSKNLSPLKSKVATPSLEEIVNHVPTENHVPIEEAFSPSPKTTQIHDPTEHPNDGLQSTEHLNGGLQTRNGNDYEASDNAIAPRRSQRQKRPTRRLTYDYDGNPTVVRNKLSWLEETKSDFE